MDFVTFETAKKLKEKGFVQGFNVYGIRPIYYNPDTIKFISDAGAYEIEYFGENISCPTISQVLKWLREEYKIYMYVERDTYHLKFRFVYEKDKPRGKFTSSIYDGFEQAALAGIEYVLNNLI